ncbi:MAG: Ldh family oxidoreductase, partial [Pirellulales bacterium]|nr:Ldh family oxidoreductase [Pirellulales bacterium]
EAWLGQIMPIGRHKGVGLAMVFEILSAILSGNQLSGDIPSIIDQPQRSADSSFFMIAVDPEALMPAKSFTRSMRQYVDYLESSTARDPANPPRYPGRREGEHWHDRKLNGIPVSPAALQSFGEIALSLSAQDATNKPIIYGELQIKMEQSGVQFKREIS